MKINEDDTRKVLGTDLAHNKDTMNGRGYHNCYCGSPEARERRTEQSCRSVAEKAFLGNSSFVLDLEEWVG